MDNCSCRTPYHRNRMQNSCRNIEPVYREKREECNFCGVEGMPLAMSYVPWQHWGETYEPCKALVIGTIFPELNLPFLERSCAR